MIRTQVSLEKQEYFQAKKEAKALEIMDTKLMDTDESTRPDGNGSLFTYHLSLDPHTAPPPPPSTRSISPTPPCTLIFRLTGDFP